MEEVIHPFPTTHWSLIRAAGQEAGTEHRRALEEFFHQYLPALRMHLLLDRHLPPTEADDLLQGFVTDKVIQDQILAQANQARGRLRNYLLAVLNNYSHQLHRHDHAQHRNPGTPLAGLEQCAAHFDRQPPPAQAYEASWARQVVHTAIHEMQQKCEREGKMEIWLLFDARVLGPLLRQEPPTPYTELVQRCQLASPSAASNLVISGKRMFTRTLREVVTQYAGDPQNVDEEIMELRKILSR